MASYYDPDEIRRLEKEAIHYYRLAVDADKRELIPLADTYYSKAIEAFSRLVDLESSQEFKKIYLKKIRECRYRLTYLRGKLSGKLSDAPIHHNPSKGMTKGEYETSSIVERPSWLNPFKSSITWDDVVGLDGVKRVFKQIILYPLRRPDLFPLGWPKYILLYGPPGCGKTTIAAAVSNEIDAEFYPIDASMIISKWLGEGEKRVAQLFRYLWSRAKSGTPIILYIDEVDSLFGTRSHEVGGEVRVRNQFLIEMDGLNTKDKNNVPLYILASTNKPWLLDPAFIRRFPKRIYIPLPDFGTRKKLFEFYLSKFRVSNNIDYDKLAAYTEGYTSSDIKDIIQFAYLEVVSEFFESGQANDLNSRPRPLEMSDLMDAIKRVKPSISESLVKVYKVWSDKFSTL